MFKSYDWADFKIDEEKIDKALEIFADDEDAGFGFVMSIASEIESDCDSTPGKLILMYKNGSPNERKIIDAFCVNLCGWSMATMIEKFIDKMI